MPGTHCTVQRLGGDFCDAPSAEDMPFPICARHAASLYRRIAQNMADVASDPLFKLRSAVEYIEEQRHRATNRPSPADKPTVYYVQVSDCVKIGYTGRLQQRMMSYPPNKRLLATEPGDYALESKRHEQFADLLAYGHEWFRPDQKLIDHINELRKQSGVPIIELRELT